VLALAAGTLLPISVVETVGQIAYMGQWLESLHRRGLAEQRDDRFGLPVWQGGMLPADPPRPPRPRVPRRALLAVGSILGALALAVGTVTPA
jgi:hypothetical protein